MKDRKTVVEVECPCGARLGGHGNGVVSEMSWARVTLWSILHSGHDRWNQ